MNDTQKAGVIRFYDTHPINEDEILAKLAARGDDLDHLTQAQLADFDQDHYGGVRMVDLLARKAGITPEHHVLDVCSGMGGPARWLASRIGCRVTGLDFTQSRVEAARRLTLRVGLAELVDFVQGDATAMPLPDAQFDAVISQEAWLHILEKAAVIAQCARVVKPGGVIAFTDVVARGKLSSEAQQRLGAEMHAPAIASTALYTQLLERNACLLKQCDDLSEEWTRILQERHRMYRSLRDTTIAKFGAARYLEYDHAYSHFVGLFAQGVLGGVRMVARRGA